MAEEKGEVISLRKSPQRLTQLEAELIYYIRTLGWGRVTVIAKEGQPVRLVDCQKEIKLGMIKEIKLD